MPKKMGVNTKAEAARARRRQSAVAGRRAPRRRPTGKRPRAPSRGRRAAARRTPRSAPRRLPAAPRTADSPSSSSSSSQPRRGAPTARPRAWAGPPCTRSPRPSFCAAARRSGSACSARPRQPRSGRRAPPTRRSTSASCSSPTPTGTTQSSRRDPWRTRLPRWQSLPSKGSRRIATPSAASRSRTRHLKKQSLPSYGSCGRNHQTIH